MLITGTVVSLLPWKVKRGTPVAGAILKPFMKEPNWGAMAAYTVVGCVRWLIVLRRMAWLLIIRLGDWLVEVKRKRKERTRKKKEKKKKQERKKKKAAAGGSNTDQAVVHHHAVLVAHDAAVTLARIVLARDVEAQLGLQGVVQRGDKAGKVRARATCGRTCMHASSQMYNRQQELKYVSAMAPFWIHPVGME